MVKSKFQVFLVPNYRAFRIPVKYVNQDARYPMHVFVLQLFVRQAAPPLDTDRVCGSTRPV